MAASRCRCLAASRPTAYSGIAPGGMRMTPKTRSWLRLAAAWLAGAVALGRAAAGMPADAPKAAAPEPPAQVVLVEGERLTVDLHGAELAQVLRQVGEAAGFHITTSGTLGVVTAAFSARTLEEGLRRLVQDHEMMLVYRPAGLRN